MLLYFSVDVSGTLLINHKCKNIIYECFLILKKNDKK